MLVENLASISIWVAHQRARVGALLSPPVLWQTSSLCMTKEFGGIELGCETKINYEAEVCISAPDESSIALSNDPIDS